MKRYKKLLYLAIMLLLSGCSDDIRNENVDHEKSETMMNQKNQWSEKHEGYLIEWAPKMMENEAFVKELADPIEGYLIYWEATKMELKNSRENYDNNVSLIILQSGVIKEKNFMLTAFFVNGTGKTVNNLGMDMDIQSKETGDVYSSFKGVSIPKEFIEEIPPYTLYGITFVIEDVLNDLDGSINKNLNQGNVTYYPTVYYDTIEE